MDFRDWQIIWFIGYGGFLWLSNYMDIWIMVLNAFLWVHSLMGVVIWIFLGAVDSIDYEI